MTCFAIGNRRGDISKYRDQCEHCDLDDCIVDSNQCVRLYMVDSKQSAQHYTATDKEIAKKRRALSVAETNNWVYKQKYSPRRHKKG